MEKPVFVRDPTILDLKSLLFCFDNNQVFNKYIHVFLFFQQRELSGQETRVCPTLFNPGFSMIQNDCIKSERLR